MGPFLILFGLAGVVAGVLSLAAKGSPRLPRIGSRKQAAVAAFLVCLAAGACAAPPQKAGPGKATSPAPGAASCGEDSYVNVDGNCVHRPVSSSSAPAGATARCADGTYSFSQHPSGTCSHHGGVAAWL